MPGLGLNAQALRFLDFLAQNTITVRIHEFAVTLPHPANFALHKLLVLSRRPTRAKKLKDKQSALGVLHALIDKCEEDFLRATFNATPRGWQAEVKRQLTDPFDRKVLDALHE